MWDGVFRPWNMAGSAELRLAVLFRRPWGVEPTKTEMELAVADLSCHLGCAVQSLWSPEARSSRSKCSGNERAGTESLNQTRPTKVHVVLLVNSRCPPGPGPGCGVDGRAPRACSAPWRNEI